MAYRPFGSSLSTYRALLDQEAAMATEKARQTAKWEFEEFCRIQAIRHAARLRESGKRIQQARWGDGQGDGHFIVTREGTTECSRPIRKPYKDQA